MLNFFLSLISRSSAQHTITSGSPISSSNKILDPRSPRNDRTPISYVPQEAKKESEFIFSDPRSPREDRTPLNLMKEELILNDPRSPREDRTPLNFLKAKLILSDPKSLRENGSPLLLCTTSKVEHNEEEIDDKKEEVVVEEEKANEIEISSLNHPSIPLRTSSDLNSELSVIAGIDNEEEFEASLNVKPQLVEALIMISRSPQLKETLKSLSPKKPSMRKRNLSQISGYSPCNLHRKILSEEEEQIQFLHEIHLEKSPKRMKLFNEENK